VVAQVLKETTALIDDLDTKIEKATDKLETVNAKLKKAIEEVRRHATTMTTSNQLRTGMMTARRHRHRVLLCLLLLIFSSSPSSCYHH
jgi:t-SNARE complex subunit (syntaxin)